MRIGRCTGHEGADVVSKNKKLTGMKERWGRVKKKKSSTRSSAGSVSTRLREVMERGVDRTNFPGASHATVHVMHPTASVKDAPVGEKERRQEKVRKNSRVEMRDGHSSEGEKREKKKRGRG
jgi:hypothetical protein